MDFHWPENLGPNSEAVAEYLARFLYKIESESLKEETLTALHNHGVKTKSTGMTDMVAREFVKLFNMATERETIFPATRIFMKGRNPYADSASE